MDKYKEINYNVKIPTLFNNEIELVNELNLAKKNFEKAYISLHNKIQKGVLNKELKADLIINKILESSYQIDIDDDIYNKAVRRMCCHNPPGKANNLGDALHWESLLSHIEHGKTLVIISNDKDFIDDLYSLSKKAHSFLEKEWRVNKKADLLFYKNLTSFLHNHMPEFELHDEFKENIANLISLLSQSYNFTMTHEIINELEQYFEHLEENDIIDIIDCYEQNNQINWILDDEDVYNFLSRIENLPTLPKNYKDKVRLIFDTYSSGDNN